MALVGERAGQGFLTHVPAIVVGAMPQKELRVRIEGVLTGIPKLAPADRTNRTRNRQNLCMLTTTLQQMGVPL